MSSVRKFHYMVGHALWCVLLLTLILGVVYPIVFTSVSNAIFPDNSKGSLVYNEEGKVIGSALIGQTFTSEDTPAFKYFVSRPSYGGYDPTASGGTNFGPNNPKQHEAIESRRIALEEARAAVHAPYVPVPYDLLTASGSGLDPHISLEAALYQAPMVAAANNMKADDIVKLVMSQVQTDLLSSVPYINVLQLNQELQKFLP